MLIERVCEANISDLDILEERISKNLHFDIPRTNIYMILKIFSGKENREKLKKFFDLDDNFYFSFDTINQNKIDFESVIVNIIKCNYEYFINDKYLFELSSILLIIKAVRETYNSFHKLYFLYDTNKVPVNIVYFPAKNMIGKTYYKSGLVLTEPILLLKEYKDKKSFNKAIGNFGYAFSSNTNYTLRDLFSVLTNLILKNVSINEIDYTNFFTDKKNQLSTTVEYYALQNKEIIETGKFLYKRKEKDIKSINKRNYIDFFSSYINHIFTQKERYLNDLNAGSFFEYIKTRKLQSDIFRFELLDDCKIAIVLLSYGYYINCHLGNKQNELEQFYQHSKYTLFYNNIDKLRTNAKRYLTHYHPETKAYLKKINPSKKLAGATKKILKDHYYDLLVLGKNMDSNNPLFAIETVFTYIKELKELNINDKNIRPLLNRLIKLEEFVFTNEHEGLSKNSSHLHDIYETYFKRATTLIKDLKVKKFTNSNLLNKVFHFFNTFTTNNTSEILKILEKISLNYKCLNTKDIQIKKLSDLNIIIANEEKRKYDKKINLFKSCLKNIDIDFSLECAGIMGKTSNAIKMFTALSTKKDLLDNFNFIDKNYKESRKKYDKLNIAVLTHNNPVGILGANVNGVCISSFGKERLSQLNKYFLNLVVYSNKGINLWGLLCEAKLEDKTYFILNNLQGSINDKKVNTNVLLNDIKDTLKAFMKENCISGILSLDHGFNALNLSSIFEAHNKEDFQIEDIKLTKQIRLDFRYNKEGYLRKNDFYILKQ